ncbi:hypothetical protein EV651_11794 [Kribbella sp. VKM Ac-2571]|uniref:hypothetical protein n=1 Tax=Kribbella sp. VKM Ac-2571 TaxID=2512222 RepID=UPI00105EC34C|nr:hypothetical protein [Kribbella sp. VKM Ac-2571]TDO52904.1 hypothetical protein EV651_11794 [Kribbella sp. VKM Ac-2571]
MNHRYSRPAAGAALALAVTAAGLIATAAPAAATDDRIERSCGDYLIHSTKYGASTRKSKSASCAGHAWVMIHYKARKDGKWYVSSWRHDPKYAHYASNEDGAFFSELKRSYHKGCADCVIHHLEP